MSTVFSRSRYSGPYSVAFPPCVWTWCWGEYPEIKCDSCHWVCVVSFRTTWGLGRGPVFAVSLWVARCPVGRGVGFMSHLQCDTGGIPFDFPIGIWQSPSLMMSTRQVVVTDVV